MIDLTGQVLIDKDGIEYEVISSDGKTVLLDNQKKYATGIIFQKGLFKAKDETIQNQVMNDIDEYLKPFKKIEFSDLKNKNDCDDPIIKLFEAVAYLHKQGYEKIRLSSYISPSGCYFRIEISVKQNFDNVTGFITLNNDKYPTYRYSTGRRFYYFGEKESLQYNTPKEVGEKLLINYPELERLGKGNDSEYVKWFERVMEIVRKGIYPYAFEDYGYDIYEDKVIRFTGFDKYIEFAPPGGEND